MRSPLKNHYFHCFITYSVGRKRCAVDHNRRAYGVSFQACRVATWRQRSSPYNSRVIRFEDTARRGV